MAIYGRKLGLVKVTTPLVKESDIMIEYYEDHICLDREQVCDLIQSIKNIHDWNESITKDYKVLAECASDGETSGEFWHAVGRCENHTEWIDHDLTMIFDQLEKVLDEYDKKYLYPKES